MKNRILVIYKSRTGFTKKYAEMIAEEIGCELADYKRATVKMMSEFDTVVFGSRVHAGFINGLKDAREMFGKSTAKNFVVFATGATPNAAENVINEIWSNNLSAEELASVPHFYMQSGLCYEKMGLFDKLMMKMVASMMKNKKDKTEHDIGFEQAIQGSYDSSSKEYAMPLINYLKGVSGDE